MPLLESLAVEDAIASPYINIHRAPIHFPQLRYLNIRDMSWPAQLGTAERSDAAIWPLLNHIVPQPGCSVRVVFTLPGAGDINVSVLSRFAEDYFKVNQPTFLELSSSRDQFRLTDLQVSEKMLLFGPIIKTPFFDLMFYIDTQLGNTSTTGTMVYHIFQALFFLSFPNVLELRLEVGVSQQASFASPQFGKLLSSFSSAEIVTTTPGTLQSLCLSAVVDISTLFPRLKVLKMPLGRSEADFKTTTPLPDILTQFLVCRKESGVPVSTFEYECTSSYEPMEDLKFLEDITDLKVIWKTDFIGSGEYLCGSGRPEELNFDKKWKLAEQARQQARRMPQAEALEKNLIEL